MTRKEAFIRKGETPHEFITTSMYNRANATRWYRDHTPEQMTYLWTHGYIMWDKPMVQLGERETDKYIVYTDLGRKWREWYTMSHWDWMKYHVFGYMFWLYKVYYPIRKHIFRKPYPWEGNENVDLDNI